MEQNMQIHCHFQKKLRGLGATFPEKVEFHEISWNYKNLVEFSKFHEFHEI